jgi:hypothetical protein
LNYQNVERRDFGEREVFAGALLQLRVGGPQVRVQLEDRLKRERKRVTAF